jgi:hypothetical protein
MLPDDYKVVGARDGIPIGADACVPCDSAPTGPTGRASFVPRIERAHRRDAR